MGKIITPENCVDIPLTQDQEDKLGKLLKWYKSSGDPVITLAGFAGTGKTTLMAFFRNSLKNRLKVNFCAYTGKARTVLQDKLVKVSHENDQFMTLHKLMYRPEIDLDGKLTGWIPTSENIENCDLIVIDEGSMVTSEINREIMRRNSKAKILVLGDHGQLGPIGTRFNWMEKPDLILTEIHRQALDSPIIQLSIRAREGKHIDIMRYSNDVVVSSDFDDFSGDMLNRDMLDDSFIITDTNNRRVGINKWMRNSLYSYNDNFPRKGDKVICLKNNDNHLPPIYNGLITKVLSSETDGEHTYKIKVDRSDWPDGTEDEYYVSKYLFNNPSGKIPDHKIKEIGGWYGVGDLFDFGYAITCHKSQGSESGSVFIFGDGRVFNRGADGNLQQKRWNYTAITRSKKKLYIYREPTSKQFSMSTNGNDNDKPRCSGMGLNNSYEGKTFSW